MSVSRTASHRREHGSLGMSRPAPARRLTRLDISSGRFKFDTSPALNEQQGRGAAPRPI